MEASKGTILVVEDESIVAADLERSLSLIGYQTMEGASSAEEALARVSLRVPDLVLMDIRLEGPNDGVQTARFLNELYDVPVIFLTAYADDLTIEARAAPYDIDQIRLGQQATVRFSSFSQSTTPELNGLVTRVAADITQDAKTGVTYYTVRVSLPPEELARLDGMKLVPGMPAEVFIQTKSRTIMSYLVKPIYDQIARTFREK